MGQPDEPQMTLRRIHFSYWITKVKDTHSEYIILIAFPQPLGRARRRWEDNIKMDLQEVGGGSGDWMELAQDRERWRALVSTVRNIRVPKMRGIS